jgi:hypothetical protein
MAELYILLLGTTLGASIAVVSFAMGARTYRKAIGGFVDLTPVQPTIDKDIDTNSTSIQGLDWDAYDDYIVGAQQEIDNEKD